MIYGEEIRLRAIEREDLPLFWQWVNDPEVIAYLGIYWPLSHADEEDWFAQAQKKPLYERPLAIEAALGDDTWQLIGNLDFHHIDWRVRQAEVGLMIGDRAFWGQGYGSRALQLLLRHGFAMLNLNRIYLHVYAPNLRAIRVYEKLGFRHEGRLRQAQYFGGQYIDVLAMSILRSEWQGKEEQDHAA